MDVVYPRCARLDVHKTTVVACARIAGDGPLAQQVRTFESTMGGLPALCDWLESSGVQRERQAVRVLHGVELDQAHRRLDGVGVHGLDVLTDAGDQGIQDSHAISPGPSGRG